MGRANKRRGTHIWRLPPGAVGDVDETEEEGKSQQRCPDVKVEAKASGRSRTVIRFAMRRQTQQTESDAGSAEAAQQRSTSSTTAAAARRAASGAFLADQPLLTRNSRGHCIRPCGMDDRGALSLPRRQHAAHAACPTGPTVAFESSRRCPLTPPSPTRPGRPFSPRSPWVLLLTA